MKEVKTYTDAHIFVSKDGKTTEFRNATVTLYDNLALHIIYDDMLEREIWYLTGVSGFRINEEHWLED